MGFSWSYIKDSSRISVYCFSSEIHEMIHSGTLIRDLQRLLQECLQDFLQEDIIETFSRNAFQDSFKSSFEISPVPSGMFLDFFSVSPRKNSYSN